MLRPYAGSLRAACRKLFGQVGHEWRDPPNRLFAVVLAFLAGGVGGHWFYLGDRRRAVRRLLLLPVIWLTIPYAWFEAYRWVMADRRQFEADVSADCAQSLIPRESGGLDFGTLAALSPLCGAFLVLVCLLGVTAACDESPTGPTVALDERFTLAVGDTATVEPAQVRLGFVEVTGDSRCPMDAICIWGGDAVVHVRATAGTSATNLELHTGDATRASATYQGLRIELKELQPYPFSSRTIAQGDYRATLTVTRN